MTTELEERLRADLPRLGELIERESVPNVVPIPRKRRARRMMTASVAASVALAAIIVGIAVRSGNHERVSTTTPTIESTPSTWRALPPSPLGSRGNAVVVWTGAEVLVWGGYIGDPNAPFAFQSGAAYNPVTNTWHKIADNQWAHPGAIGFWGGDRMYVLAKNGGAYYLPSTNQWHDLPRLENEQQSGFIGGATDGTTLYGIVYNENTKQPQIEVFVYRPGFTAWQRRTPLQAPLQPGVGRIPTVWSGQGLVPTVWNGSELIVSDGGANLSAYDPVQDSWRALPALPGAASATSLTISKGSLAAVFTSDGKLSAARFDGSTWHVVASDDSTITQPFAIDAGGELVVFDRAGHIGAVRVDETTATFRVLDGYPIPLGTGRNAVWAGDGLFVWGGIPQGTAPPAPADAAWYGK